eukprot:14928015-Alexandrium_andersonii.AAC.1
MAGASDRRVAIALSSAPQACPRSCQLGCACPASAVVAPRLFPGPRRLLPKDLRARAVDG